MDSKYLGIFVDQNGNSFKIWQKFTGWSVDGTPLYEGWFDVLDLEVGTSLLFDTLPESWVKKV